jgi:hypothetical protein
MTAKPSERVTKLTQDGLNEPPLNPQPMSHKELFLNLLVELYAEFGSPPLAVNEDGYYYCVVQMDGYLPIVLLQQQEVIRRVTRGVDLVSWFIVAIVTDIHAGTIATTKGCRGGVMICEAELEQVLAKAWVNS